MNMITKHATKEINTYSFTNEIVSWEDDMMLSFRWNRNKLWLMACIDVDELLFDCLIGAMAMNSSMRTPPKKT